MPSRPPVFSLAEPPTTLTVTAPRPPRPGLSITPGRDKRDKGSAPSIKGRRWVFTLNNYTEDDCTRLLALDAPRLIIGKEVAPTTGTPHLQGYVRFSNPIRFSWWKTFNKRISARMADGSDTQNEVYCTKEGNVLVNHGVNCDESLPKVSRDEETDQIIAEIESGALYGAIRQRHKRFCFWHRRNILDYIRDERFCKDYPDQNPTV